MRTRTGIRSYLTVGKVPAALLLGVMTITMVIPGTDVALSQSGTRSSSYTFTTMDVPNSILTYAGGINNSDQIVGSYADANGLRTFAATNSRSLITLDVPQWYQRGIPPFQVDAHGYAVPNNWGKAKLDSTPGSSHLTIAKAGCALTVLTIVANYWEKDRISPTPANPKPGGAFTPMDLNTSPWDLYLPGISGDVSWKEDILETAGIGLVRILPDYSNSSSYDGFDVFPDPKQTLDNILRNGAPVILRILTDTGATIHFVVVTGKATNGDYIVNDPGWYPPTTLSKLPKTGWWRNHVRKGETPCIPCSLTANNFLVYANKPITKQDPLTLKGLDVYSTDPVDFILTDPLGRRTGFDPVAITSFRDIPVSDYSTTLYEDEQDPSSPNPPPLKALVMANQMDGQYTLDVIGTGRGRFTVDVIASDGAGNEIRHSYSGSTAPGVTSRFTFEGAVTAFTAFRTRLGIRSAAKAFEMNSTFTLGPGGTISPLQQPATIQLGNTFLVTIPSGSFHLVKNRDKGPSTWAFAGTIQGVALEARLAATDGNGYAFKIEGVGAPNLPSANPIEVRLAIGNDGGRGTVNGDIAR